MQFTTSWDDGHPLDLRLADLLAHHGFQATFYVPNRNQEGLPVLSNAQLCTLGSGFEIGSHTLDHCYANRVPPAEWTRQVREGKQALENALGHSVAGFCYPGGKVNPQAIESVKAAGFHYARTVVNLHLEGGNNRFLIPTTLQFYPHGRAVIARNWLRAGQWANRWPATVQALSASDHQRQLMRLLEAALKRDGVFHLWGHSWELERHALWAPLDSFLRSAAQLVPNEARVINARLNSARADV